MSDRDSNSLSDMGSISVGGSTVEIPTPKFSVDEIVQVKHGKEKKQVYVAKVMEVWFDDGVWMYRVRWNWNRGGDNLFNDSNVPEDDIFDSTVHTRQQTRRYEPDA